MKRFLQTNRPGAIWRRRGGRAGRGRLWVVVLALVVWVALDRAPCRAQVDEALPALVELLAQSDDAQFQIDLLKGMNEGLKGRREVPMPPGWEGVSSRLGQSPNAEVRNLVRSLSLVFGSASAMGDLRQQLMDRQSERSSREGALASLLAAKDPELPGLLEQLLAESDLRRQALRALAAYNQESIPGSILKIYAELSLAEKQDALNTLVARVAFAQALLDGIESKKVPARDLSADIVRQLRQYNDESINRRVTELWGVTRETGADKLQQIEHYKALLAKGPPGDVARGRAVFARTCQQCHTLFSVGGKVGPDITGSNRGDLDYILHNMVDPNAEIPNDYRTSTLETKDDRVLTGIIQRQDAQAVTIITANDTVLVPRAEVQSIQESSLSMMPEGMLDLLQEQEVRDLVAYLKVPSQVPMLATADNVGSFFNGINLEGWEGDLNLWKVEEGEIVGRSPGLQRNEWLSGPLLLGDFRFQCEVKLVPNSGNSGIQFRSQRLEDGEVKGYQADMGQGWWGKLYEEHGRALLWARSGEDHVKPGEWNRYEIVAVGHRIRTLINGKTCVEMEDPDGALQGIIAFQIHSGGPMEVRLRNLLLEVDPDPGWRTGQP